MGKDSIFGRKPDRGSPILNHPHDISTIQEEAGEFKKYSANLNIVAEKTIWIFRINAEGSSTELREHLEVAFELE